MGRGSRGALALVAAAAVLAIVLRPHAGSNPCGGAVGFSFSARGGDVSCDGNELAAGVLPIGGTLDTGDHEAELAIADIGKADLGPATLVRLDRTSATGHHLSLERGHMHAKVDAPPRLFAVATPMTDVTDLGCEYTLDIDATGAGSVRVSFGKVELGSGSALVVVPEGTHAAILAGHRAGLPVADGSALEPEIEALQAGAPGAVETLLAHATPRDAITLVNLAAVTDPARRRPILERLNELSPPPGGIDLDDVADPAMFELWRDDVVTHYESSGPGKRERGRRGK